MSKAREFWLDEFYELIDTKAPPVSARNKDLIVHVIEKSAYDEKDLALKVADAAYTALQAKLDKAVVWLQEIAVSESPLDMEVSAKQALKELNADNPEVKPAKEHTDECRYQMTAGYEIVEECNCEREK